MAESSGHHRVSEEISESALFHHYPPHIPKFVGEGKAGFPNEDHIIASKLQDFTKSYKESLQHHPHQHSNNKPHYTSPEPMEYITSLQQERGMISGLTSFRYGPFNEVLNPGPSDTYVPEEVHLVGPVLEKYDPLFIFVVESEDLFSKMLHCRYHKRFPCVILRSAKDNKGLPDMRTRWLLKKLHSELKLPVLALVPCTPQGLNLLSVYTWGLKDDPMDLDIPDLIWLGLKPSQLDKHGIRQAWLESMSSKDKRIANKLLAEFQNDREWNDELRCLIRIGKKAEIELMWSIGSGYIPYCYLPLELEDIASSLPK